MRIGRYELLDDLGRGGMGGAIYLARDVVSRREVALKTLRPEYLRDESILPRFRREAEVYARLDHPHIVKVFDNGFADGHHYIAMEHVRGPTLLKLMKDSGRIERSRGLGMFRDLLGALAHAHDRGIVHRDLKPQNILVADGDRVKVIDFGVAAAQDGLLKTTPGSLIGTYLYASPEQNEGRPVDHRSDLYSLGVIVWELLAGQRALSATDFLSVIRLQQQESIPPLSSLPGLASSARLDRMVSRLLRADPARRYQSAHEVLADLYDVLADP